MQVPFIEPTNVRQFDIYRYSSHTHRRPLNIDGQQLAQQERSKNRRERMSRVGGFASDSVSPRLVGKDNRKRCIGLRLIAHQRPCCHLGQIDDPAAFHIRLALPSNSSRLLRIAVGRLGIGCHLSPEVQDLAIRAPIHSAAHLALKCDLAHYYRGTHWAIEPKFANQRGTIANRIPLLREPAP